jgi:hypothetical protein
MKHLPIHRGYPVPWFVHWLSRDEPEFRVIDPEMMVRAVRQNLCWVCGQTFTNRRKAFTIGPMCCVNRISAEPPAHVDCAQFSAKGCPFLSRPYMERRENDLPGIIHVQDGHLAHNPGVTAVWHTRRYKVLRQPNGWLFEMDEPTHVEWYCRGREATREECVEAVMRGSVKLMEQAAEDPEDRKEAKAKIAWVIDNLLPREGV